MPQDDGPPPRTPKDATPPTARRFRGYTLNAFQLEALTAIEAGRSVLLSAPTGAGKTLVAEYAIEETLSKGMRAIYTAPIKALSNQKYRDFKARPEVEVGIMTGDVTIRPEAPLLIMTTEIFRNTIFEAPRDLDDVEYVVFDEIHYMDDLDRGTVWEESIIFAPPHIRFICLSATVSNLTQFGEWIARARGTEVQVIRHDHRPVPLKHYLFMPGIGPRRAEDVKKFPRLQRNRGRGPKFDVIDLLEQNDSKPALFFCFSRRECEARARENKKRGLLAPDEQRVMAREFDDICATFQIAPDGTQAELRALALEGVGFHHAGLLPLHKELVERLFTRGLLKLLFTTETFALGINMPARAVVFSALRKFDGTGFSTIKAREYQQMAGRAGRQGIDDEGLVYSIIDDDRLDLEEVRRVIFGQVEPIRSRFNLSYSTLLNLHRTLGPKIFEAWEQSFNNFQWIRMPAKKREKNRKKQEHAIATRLDLLRTFDYIEGERELKEKGKLAALINGFELPVTELLDSGLFDWMSAVELVVVLASLVFEERRGDQYRRPPRQLLRETRADVERVVGRLIQAELDRQIGPTVRPPNWLIASVAHAFATGASFEDLGQYTSSSQGDVVRVFRLVIQLIRQVKKAVRGRQPLTDKLDEALLLVNRDVVDAKRQLELG